MPPSPVSNRIAKPVSNRVKKMTLFCTGCKKPKSLENRPKWVKNEFYREVLGKYTIANIHILINSRSNNPNKKQIEK